MFLARLICTDPDCAERIEEHVVDLAELDLLACECGCTWELLAVSSQERALDPAWAERLGACRPLVMT